jgi:CBS domain-containing protein
MHTPLSVLLKDKGYVTHHISAQASVYECVLKLNQFGIGALLVMEGDKLLGIVSERDLIRKLLGNKSDQTKVRVEEIMSKDLLTVPPSMTVQEAMKIVTEKRIRHLPVVEDDKLVGLISIGDLTRWAMLQQEKEIEALTGYIHGKA